MKKAGDFLAAFLDESVIQKARGYSNIFSSWPAIAREVKMPALAGHSWIREIEKSLLFVEADHPGWIQLLQTKQREILLALRRRFPKENLSGISFRLSREGPPQVRRDTERDPGQGPAAEKSASPETSADRNT